jgi:hypothetical protein
MKKTLITLLTALTLSVSGQTQSVVIDVQQQINNIKANQNASGLMLIQAKQDRMYGLITMTATSVLGGTFLAAAKGNVVVSGFGVALITVGGACSVYKLVESFNNIGKAGKALLN